MSASGETYGVVSCMKDEGQFVLEWIAYHKVIGFDGIVIATNDCTDGSDALLARLAERGEITHLDHSVKPGLPPQVEGLRKICERGLLAPFDWVLHIDADEFLEVTCGEGRVGDLVAAVDPCDVIAIHWQMMGDNGLTTWHGGSVLQAFTRGQPHPVPRISFHKSLFRPGRFRRLRDHMPKDPVSEEVIVRTTANEPVSPGALFTWERNRFNVGADLLTWDNARIRHYAVKSRDVMLMKNRRGRGLVDQSAKYTVNSRFHRSHNWNTMEDRSILRFWAAVEAELARLRSDPETDRLHRHCVDWFAQRRDETLTPEQIAAWTVEHAPRRRRRRQR
ncbi:MAG: glycosyltransferase family 2 protein [Rubricella sp.]